MGPEGACHHHATAKCHWIVLLLTARLTEEAHAHYEAVKSRRVQGGLSMYTTTDWNNISAQCSQNNNKIKNKKMISHSSSLGNSNIHHEIY